MEKANHHKPTVESPNLLGKIYRVVDCKKYFRKALKIDHQYSFVKKYKINTFLL